MEATTEQPGAEQTFHILEIEQVFSQSLLWKIQRRYFEIMGVEAWRQGEVPHYVTSNPMMANSYAEIAFAFLCDQERRAPVNEPLTICELGAGSGRFAFHFLERLRLRCEQANLPLTSFRYILTDFTQRNLDFWQAHPSFQPFFENGVLDCALFDATTSKRLRLQRCGEVITPGSLRRPLVVIANYLFDTIPQDLLYFDDQQCDECVISLRVEEDPRTLDIAGMLTALEYHLSHRPLAPSFYREAYLRRIIAEYERTLTNAYVLFPAPGMRCLHRLSALSHQGLMLLSADKGYHRLASLQHRAAPTLVRHGSFSFSVNYHALKAMCEGRGGIALFPTAQHRSVNICCLLMVPEATDYRETRGAYRRYVEEFSPDDYFSVIKHARADVATMSVEEMLAYLRLSHHDGYLFPYYLPRLVQLIPEFGDNDRDAVIAAVEKVWETHFPLGGTFDLADQIARFLYEMGEYARAITFFEYSMAAYGAHTGTVRTMAMCHQHLGQHARAEDLLASLPTDDSHESSRHADT